MIHVANLCLSIIGLAVASLGTELFGIVYDYRFISFPHSSCFILNYIVSSQSSMLNFSLFLQAFYRYLCIVHSTRIFYQSWKFQLILIILTWIIGYLLPLEYFLHHDVVANTDNKMCVIPFRLSFSIIYMATSIYMVPFSSLMLTYLRIIRYVKQMNNRVTPVNVLVRAQRDLEIVRRTIILVCILIACGFPFVILIFISLFTDPPKYTYRISN
ncbi:unnamed protein product, partial [Adineta steineri]